MTETRIEGGPLIPVGMAIGQTVGQAEAVMTRLLAGVLAETGTARQTYVCLAAPAGAWGRRGARGLHPRPQ